MKPITVVTAIACAFVAVQPVIAAAPAKEPRPQLFQKLVDCRTLIDPQARLACYDAQVAALDAAEARSDVVVVDRAQIRTARRSLFGLTLPRLNIFGSRDSQEDEEEFKALETKIGTVFRANYSNWGVILADGARWVQTDGRSIRDPKPGQPIRIRQAAMGSYLANINNQTAVRMKREN